MPTNTAAWINRAHGRLVVGPAPYTAPAEDQIVVRNRAVAINPIDWIIQAIGPMAYRWLTYPTVLGSDVAGEVVEVGAAVTRFRVGDRVIAHAVGSDKDADSAAEGAFQHYTVVLERLTSPIPDSLAYVNAAVLPLAVSTASVGLFETAQLGLQHPSAQAQPTGQTLLVWGGSTSVGSNAIQLAVAAGYEVITTASPRNFDYVRSLGAVQVFDYHSPTVINDLIAAFHGRVLAGAIAFGATGPLACVKVVHASSGNRFVSIASTPVSFESLAAHDRGRWEFARVMTRLIYASITLQLSARRRGVRTKMVFGTTLKSNEVSTAIYRDFLPSAMADGRYRPVPAPTVSGHRLDDVQHAMDTQRHGVSATKIVVSLP